MQCVPGHRRSEVSRAQLRPHQLGSKHGVVFGAQFTQSFIEFSAVVETVAVCMVFRTHAHSKDRVHNIDEMRVLVQQGGGHRVHVEAHAPADVATLGCASHSWPFPARTSSESSPGEEQRAEDEFILRLEFILEGDHSHDVDLTVYV
jgi:hypothetical protein